MTQVTRVPFHGTSILTNPDGTQIVVRPVCDALHIAHAAATDENKLKDMWPAADDDVRAAIRQRVDQLRGGDAA